MGIDFLQQHIEALVFCAAEPITVADIARCLGEMFGAEVPEEAITQSLAELQAKYADDAFVFSVVHLAGGYQFLTKPAYQASIAILLKQKNRRRLSTSALETLSIIAYKQPVTKTQVEQIRGVNCDYALHKLLDKQLVEIKGKSDLVGRPLLYGTGRRFMEYFGINHLSQLPQPKDVAPEEGEAGEVPLS
jgi:segregation and condensation protein B